MLSVFSDGKEFKLNATQTKEAIAHNVAYLGLGKFFSPFDQISVDICSTAFVLQTLKIQADLDLTVDGQFGPKTKEAFEGVYGPKALRNELELSPRWVKRWGYYHAHTMQAKTFERGCPSSWPIVDATWHNLVNQNSWLAAILRLVSGYNNNPANPLYDRPLVSVITLDTISLGFDHTWLGTLSKRLKLVRDSLSFSVIRPNKAREISDKLSAFILEVDSAEKVRGKQGIEYGSLTDRLAKFWVFKLSTLPEVQLSYTQAWVDTYVKPTIKAVKAFGWNANDGVTVAAVVRMQNSAQANFQRYTREALENGINTRDSAKTLEFIYKRLYKHPERLSVIKTDPDFKLKPSVDVSTLFDKFRVNIS